MFLYPNIFVEFEKGILSDNSLSFVSMVNFNTQEIDDIIYDCVAETTAPSTHYTHAAEGIVCAPSRFPLCTVDPTRILSTSMFRKKLVADS